MDKLTTARLARDAAAHHHSNVKGGYGRPYGRDADVEQALNEYVEARDAVKVIEAEYLADTKARAAKHTNGGVATENETTEETLNRWAWIDMQYV